MLLVVSRLTGPRLVAVYQTDSSSDDGWKQVGKNQWRKELSDSRKLCLGIIEYSKIIALGCGHIVLDELHLTAIAVHPKYRRRGLATKVISDLLKKANQANCTKATLEVRSDNPEAIALYTSFGFITAGRRRKYYKNGADALIQWRSLNL